MEKTETTKKTKRKITVKKAVKPLKKCEFFGIFKGKVHFDDSVFNLG